MPAKESPLEFKAEARQLLQLLTHSVYSNKDVFLRELLSNASDALDKLRMESYLNKELDADTSDLHIVIETNPERRTLTVRDNGIGMTRDEVVDLIGTLAKSGADDFVNTLRESGGKVTEHLIGQFGVGFYASFMVAEQITLITRRVDEKTGTRWKSNGDNYTLASVRGAPPGTSVTLHLKDADPDDDLFDYTAEWKIREIVERYSNFISWPIRMEVEVPAEEAPTEPEDPNTEAQDDAPTTVHEMQTINSRKAIWSMSPQEVTDEEYHALYREVSGDWNPPLRTIHMKAEGSAEFQAVLFIPTRAPLDLYVRNQPLGIQLYVRRVHIMDDYTELMPDYLRFITGVVDAQGLSLNVARESLQHDRQVHLMRRRLAKKVLATITNLMSSDPERYHTFWGEFGHAVKEGLISDPGNREALFQSASFESTNGSGALTTLNDYVSRMKNDQEHIYYLTGESRAKIESSPHMEAFRAKGYEVLVLTDPVDELWVNTVDDFDGWPFQSIAQGEVDLGDDEQEKDESSQEQQEEGLDDLLAWLSEELADEIMDARASRRLTVSAACIVGDNNEMSPTMEKRYRAMGHDVPQIKRVLEVNPNHPLIQSMQRAVRANEDDPALAELAELVHGTALLAEGGELADPARFGHLLTNRLTRAMDS